MLGALAEVDFSRRHLKFESQFIAKGLTQGSLLIPLLAVTASCLHPAHVLLQLIGRLPAIVVSVTIIRSIEYRAEIGLNLVFAGRVL